MYNSISSLFSFRYKNIFLQHVCCTFLLSGITTSAIANAFLYGRFRCDELIRVAIRKGISSDHVVWSNTPSPGSGEWVCAVIARKTLVCHRGIMYPLRISAKFDPFCLKALRAHWIEEWRPNAGLHVETEHNRSSVCTCIVLFLAPMREVCSFLMLRSVVSIWISCSVFVVCYRWVRLFHA